MGTARDKPILVFNEILSAGKIVCLWQFGVRFQSSTLSVLRNLFNNDLSVVSRCSRQGDHSKLLLMLIERVLLW